MSEPLAYLLTFRTYGTWLHGDERGSIDRDHNEPGSPLMSPDRERTAAARGRMRANALIFDDAMRATVDAAFLDQCRHRGWELIARAVRTNHVHVVIGCAEVRPERMAGELKARATRRLRERGHLKPDQPVWSSGPGSRRYLWTSKQVSDAVDYVEEGQDLPR